MWPIVAAPAIGGFIYAAGAAWAYGLCIVLLIAGIFSSMGIDHVPMIKSLVPASLSTMFAGFGFMASQPVVLGAISLDLFAVVLGGAVALLPIYAKDILHTGPEGLGLLRSAPAVGSFLLGAFVARNPIRRNVGRKLFTAVSVFGLSILVFAYSTSFWLSLIALAVSGAADVVSVVVRQTLVQLETPDEMRGRVSAVNAAFISTSNQLGEFRAGAMAAWLGPVGSAMVGGLGTLIVVVVWMRLFPRAREARPSRPRALAVGASNESGVGLMNPTRPRNYYLKLTYIAIWVYFEPSIVTPAIRPLFVSTKPTIGRVAVSVSTSPFAPM